MKSGYKLQWSDRAILDLENIIDYLIKKWSDKEVENFVRKLDKRLELLILNPNLFPKVIENVRRSVLTKHTVIYYKVSSKIVNIITLFDTRQNPKKLML